MHYYDRGILQTIKNLRGHFECSLLQAKNLVDTYRTAYNCYNWDKWLDVDPSHFDAFIGICSQLIIADFPLRNHILQSIRMQLEDFNYKYGTDYVIAPYTNYR